MINIAEFEHIVGEHSHSVYKYCHLRLGGDECLAEEAVGDVFRILFEKRDTFDPEGDIARHLYCIADHCIRRTKRELERRERIEYVSRSCGRDGGAFSEEEQSVWYDEYFADESAEAEYAEKLRDSLPEELRELFDMKYTAGLSINEIADELRLPYSTARLRLLRMERLVRTEVRRIFG